MDQNQIVEIITKVTAKAQADENFKKEYIANPKKVLSDAGLNFPEEINIHFATSYKLITFTQDK